MMIAACCCLLLVMASAQSCAKVHVAATSGGGGVLVWTGVSPPERAGGMWVRHPSSSTWHWVAAGAAAGIVAAARITGDKRVAESKVRYGSAPIMGDPCQDKPPGRTLVNWRISDTFFPDIRLDCDGFNWLMHQQTPPKLLSHMYECITLILANATVTLLGPRSTEWKWRGGNVIVSEEDRIITARPIAGRNWDECLLK
jgi:hypothetical protein